MATIRSVFIGQASGSINDITYKVRGGKTIGSFRIGKKGRGGSLRQVVRRAQWGNLVNVFQAFQGDLHPSFEARTTLVSDFNLFMKANLGLGVYLTKDEVRMGGSVAAAYVVTEGSIPTVSVLAGTGDVPRTNISLGGLTLSPSTLLKEFSEAVVNHNQGFAIGDEIACFLMKQVVDSNTQVPRVIVKAQKLTLKTSDSETLLRDVVDGEGFSVVDNCLGLDQSVNGAVTWVHSRKDADGKTLVSRQEMFVTNSVLTNYTSAAQLQKAVVSYDGRITQDFLTPDDPNNILTPSNP